jgi:hypothetical protein
MGILVSLRLAVSFWGLNCFISLLDTMPVTFDTPMFWPEADLEGLRGTSIAGKIMPDSQTNSLGQPHVRKDRAR